MKKIVLGVLIMALGAFLLLNNMGFFIPQVYKWVISWQALLIAIGFVLLFDKHSDHKIAGVALVFVGFIFLIPKIFPVCLSGVIIPLVIIGVGVAFVIKAAVKKSGCKDHETFCNESPEWKKHFGVFEKNNTSKNGGIIRKEYVFSGSKEKWTQGKLKNLEIEAVFSGVELDLSQAELADDVQVAAHIKVTSVFSGVTIYVPDDWNIMVQKSGAFGGFSDNRPNRVIRMSSDKLVVLELEAVFGGGEIRCYK